MKGPISFAVFLILIVWGIYRCYQIKKERYFQGLLALCIFQLHYYPLWLPKEFVFSGFCLLGCGALLYRICFQKQDKNLLIYAGVFLFCCLIFFVQGLMHIDSSQRHKSPEKSSFLYKNPLEVVAKLEIPVKNGHFAIFRFLLAPYGASRICGLTQIKISSK